LHRKPKRDSKMLGGILKDLEVDFTLAIQALVSF
jgi:hypothetical protein